MTRECMRVLSFFCMARPKMPKMFYDEAMLLADRRGADFGNGYVLCHYSDAIPNSYDYVSLSNPP